MIGIDWVGRKNVLERNGLWWVGMDVVDKGSIRRKNGAIGGIFIPEGLVGKIVSAMGLE
jgi:hypothetical protein